MSAAAAANVATAATTAERHWGGASIASSRAVHPSRHRIGMCRDRMASTSAAPMAIAVPLDHSARSEG